MCQRRTGAPFGQQARWANEDARTEGRSITYVRTGDSGGTIRFQFCPECGATVYFTIDAFDGLTAVPVGAFGDANFPAPTFSMYESRKHRWGNVPADIRLRN